MDVKFGNYVIYKSREYKAIRNGDQIEIISENPEDQFAGFVKYSEGYIKTLDLKDITAANRVQTMAKFKNRDFLLLSSKMGYSLITSGDVNDHQLLDWGFEQVNKGEYRLEHVKQEKLDKVWEVREPIWQDIIKNNKDLWKF
ncbi:hypothetical protein P8610_19460 [Fictibacillus sp. UD]|uniref:hypothetical protein n=1 Tax=Fictibacillus sp. UD TaxID=3038777 RepID=UPI003744D2FB